MPRHLGPVSGQYIVALGIILHLPGAGHAGPAKAQIKSADTGEQRTECRLHLLNPMLSHQIELGLFPSGRHAPARWWEGGKPPGKRTGGMPYFAPQAVRDVLGCLARTGTRRHTGVEVEQTVSPAAQRQTKGLDQATGLSLSSSNIHIRPG